MEQLRASDPRAADDFDPTCYPSVFSADLRGTEPSEVQADKNALVVAYYELNRLFRDLGNLRRAASSIDKERPLLRAVDRWMHAREEAQARLARFGVYPELRRERGFTKSIIFLGPNQKVRRRFCAVVFMDEGKEPLTTKL